MKSLKMFAIAVMAFAVMATGVSAISCEGDTIYAQGTEGCYTLEGLKTLSKDDTITLLKDVKMTADDMEVSKNVTIDLNGSNIEFGANKSIVVSGKLTIKGEGEISNAESTTDPLIEVNGGATLNVEGKVTLTNKGTAKASPAVMVAGDTTKDTKVTFESGVTVTSDSYGLVVDGDSSAPRVTVNMAGNWETKGYVAKVNGTVKYNASAPVMNINAGTYKSTESTALYASGYATWNIKDGSIEGKSALEVRSGVVNLSGGTLKAVETTGDGVDGSHAIKNSNAINVIGGETGYERAGRITLNVTGGKIVSEVEDGYAMYIKGLGKDGKISVTEKSTATFTSGTGDDGQLAAIKVDDTNHAEAKAFVENHKNMIKGGEFTGAIFEKVAIEDNTYLTSDELAADLVSGNVNTEDGNTTVGDTTPGDQGNTGDGTQTTTPGDTNPDVPDVPKTNDNILVYAGLGLVSALTVSFSAKRKENN